MTRAASLRAGLLHFTAPPVVGGVEAIVNDQTRLLARRGHRVTVLAGRGRPTGRETAFALVPALDSKHPELLAVNRALARGDLPPAFHELRDHLESELEPVLSQLDVCVVHNALSLHFNLPLTAALWRLVESGRCCPLVAWCHDLSWANPLYLHLMFDRFPWALLRKWAPRTSYVVVSDERRSQLERLAGPPPGPLAVVPAGIDPAEKLGFGRSVARLLAEYQLLRAHPFVLLPVRITRRKNIELAIRVVAELRSAGWDPRLLVTGPRGPHDPVSSRYVRELCALRSELNLEREVILLQADTSPAGRRWRPTDAMMDELYRAADVLLFPSAQEGFGIPLLEAGAVNLPIFCSDIPPFREIAGQDADYFGLDDAPHAIASSMIERLGRDHRYRLRKRVVNHYDWDLIVDRQLVPILVEAASGATSSASQ